MLGSLPTCPPRPGKLLALIPHSHQPPNTSTSLGMKEAVGPHNIPRDSLVSFNSVMSADHGRVITRTPPGTPFRRSTSVSTMRCRSFSVAIPSLAVVGRKCLKHQSRRESPGPASTGPAPDSTVGMESYPDSGAATPTCSRPLAG